jgi:hypothetical protein
MSRRHKLKTRDKVTQKMSRDGLVESNMTTGEDARVSQREAEIDLRGKTPERETYSQSGNRSADTKPKLQNKAAYRQNEPLREPEPAKHQIDAVRREPLKTDAPHTPTNETEVKTRAEHITNTSDMPRSQPGAPVNRPSDPRGQPHGKGKIQNQRKSAYRQEQPTALRQEPPNPDQPFKFEPAKDTARTGAENNADTPDVRQSRPDITPDKPRDPQKQPNDKSKARTRQRPAYRQEQPSSLRHEPLNPDQPLKFEPTKDAARTETEHITGAFDVRHNRPDITPDRPRDPQKRPGGKSKYGIKRNSAYKDNTPATSITESEQSVPATTGRYKVKKNAVYRQKQPAPEPETKPTRGKTPERTNAPVSDKPGKPRTAAPQKTGDKPEPALKKKQPGKLKFAEDEALPEKPKNHRKLTKAEHKAECAGGKLEKAKGKLPVKRKVRYGRVFEEKRGGAPGEGKVKRKLYFEKEVKTQAQHLKGPLPLRPVKAGVNSALVHGHRKIFQVEHENVGTQAAHKVEMAAEGGVRSALRFRKTAPYRKVTKLEKQASKKTVKLAYQKTLAENPKLSSNMLSRMWQKRKIKKDYAKAAREAKKAAQRAKKAGSITADAAKAVAGVVKRHPVATLVVVLLGLLIFMLMSLIGVGGGVGSGGLGVIFEASYLAEDEDIDKAELTDTEWETDLRLQIANTETDRPGYDEYKYNIGNIGHDPYELMGYLTAMYEDFTYDAISGELRSLFDEQYTLTFTEKAETRYTVPEDEDGEPEPYEYKTLTVSLTVKPLGDIVFGRMDAEQFAHYSILSMTKGCRDIVGNPFGFNWLPFVTSGYGWRVHPITGVKDLHCGIDIGFPKGTEIKSAQEGTVTFAGVSGGYGNVVVIDDGNGLVTKYAHCDTLLVSEGQKVHMGDVIATVGSTGSSTGPHLHFEVMKDGQYMNPSYFADTGS